MSARITNRRSLALGALAGTLVASIVALALSSEYGEDPFADPTGRNREEKAAGDQLPRLRGASGRQRAGSDQDNGRAKPSDATAILPGERRRQDPDDQEVQDHDAVIAGFAQRLMAGSLPPGPLLQYLANALATAVWDGRQPRLDDDGSLDSLQTTLVYGTGTARYRLHAELVHHDRRLVEGQLRLAIPAAGVGRRIGVGVRDQERLQAMLCLELRLRPPSEARDVPMRAEVRVEARSVDEEVRRAIATANARSGLGPLVRVWCHHDDATHAHVLPMEFDRHGRPKPASRQAGRDDQAMSPREREDLLRIVTGLERLLRSGNPDQPR